MSRFRILPLLVAAAFAVTACDEDPNDPGPDYPPQGALVSGDLQNDTVGDELPLPLVVRVTDQDGRPLSGQNVTFTVTAGGGSVFAATSQTNAAGEASNRWTLGTVAGDTQRVEARIVDPESGQPVVLATFRAVGRPDAPATLTARPPAARTGTAGQVLADSLEAVVRDQYGNGIPGATVVWLVTGGGGTVSPASATTDAAGVARAQWTLGLQLGQQTAEASLSPAVRVQFTATAGVPVGAVLAKVSGDGQTGTAGTTLGQPVVVQLRTSLGQPLAGASITWTPAAGSGTATPPVSITDPNGAASTAWTLGGTAGPQQLTASAEGVAPVTFGATATAGAAATLAIVGGNGQTAPPNARVPQPLGVRVTDAFGNPVPGVTVTWTVTGGGGSITATSRTEANGIAQALWTLGPAEGANTATATAPGTSPVTFTATAQVGPLDRIEVTPATLSFASLGETAQLTARPMDAQGNTVSGVTLTWTSVNGAVATVSSTGLVTAVGNGTTTIRASGGGKVGEATVTVQQVPASVTVSLARTSIVEPDTTRATAVVRDARGQAIAGAPVTWSTTNAGVATVDAAGLVTARGSGTASIVATTANGVTGSRAIAVTGALRTDTLAVGARHLCVLAEGTAYCAGGNLGRQLGGVGNSLNFNRIQGYTFASITAGDAWTPKEFFQSHTCGVEADGDAYCWGNNESGQLGYDDGRTFERTTVTVCQSGFEYTFICTETPRQVAGGGWRQLDAGANHTCGITTSGAAFCWGKDNYGQLGSAAPNGECWLYEAFGAEQPFACSLTPVAVGDGRTYKQIGAGEDFTCALTTGGAAYCWGRSNGGQLGDGTFTSRAAPVAVLGGHTFARISVGRAHACGVTTGGSVYCWGSNARGQLGMGTIGGARTTPVLVAGSYTVVSAGKFHTCALDAQGRAWCWGENENQQVDDGTTVDRPSPTLTTSPHRFVDVGAAAIYNCGRRADGLVFCGLRSTAAFRVP